MNKASCLCGAVIFTVARFEKSIAHCHCTMCQKFHGAAFSTFAEVKTTNLAWLEGQGNLAAYQAENKSVRQFCSICGSSLTFESSYNRQDHTIEVALAAFDQLESPVAIRAHIFVQSKAPWFELTDALPKYQKFRA